MKSSRLCEVDMVVPPELKRQKVALFILLKIALQKKALKKNEVYQKNVKW